jgi:hypothetical protein
MSEEGLTRNRLMTLLLSLHEVFATLNQAASGPELWTFIALGK